MKASKLLVSACASLALLNGCGGGSGNTTVLASVAKVTTDQVIVGQTTRFTISGQNLDKGYTATIPACTSVTEVAGGSATERVLTCTIATAGTSNYTIAAANGLTLYSGILTAILTTKPQVTKVTTDQVVYRKVTNFTITGQNLNLGINATIPACLSITELAGSTATQKVLSCKIVGVGASTYSITAADNTALYSDTVTVPLAAQPQVTMSTTLGNIVVELNPAKAPVTVDNFLNYVESGFYANKIFHRVVNNFVVQGGGFTKDLQQPSTLAPIKLETPNGLSNLRGSIAMARTNDPNSATSQFYFNVADNTTLDGATAGTGYAVFGKIVTGLDVMDKMKVVPTTTALGMTDVPVTPIVINSMVQTQ